MVIIPAMLQKIMQGLEVTIVLLVLAALTGYSDPSLSDPTEQVRAYTRQIEFNYISWMANAALVKLRTESVGAPYTLDHTSQKQIVMDYLRNTQNILDKEQLLTQIFADASITDKQSASQQVRDELTALYARQSDLAPLAESILQEQVSEIMAEQGLTAGGQPIPSIWFHSTPLPLALIVSPRDHIEQLADISLKADLTIDAQVKLEDNVDKGLNDSSLVVNLGGVGVYPTMVYRSTDLRWTLSTISHEWAHNYLTLRPLGLSYEVSPELRTMNETTASIVGDEVGKLVLQKFYPELSTTIHPKTLSLKPDFSLVSVSSSPHQPDNSSDQPFDFRAEMHETRVTVDAMLADGKIDEAETYMETRRQVFLQNGYLLRKLNQAYFAFHGAYADVPGGAAGEDPVGPAVRALRAQSSSLVDFVNTISWMYTFKQLQDVVGK